MVSKGRATTAARGGRGGARKSAKPGRQGVRNITRWSANKDIALLCALAKECRRDRFQPSWDRVAKWIGPNITGAAVEQHVAKLHSKLQQHRATTEPKSKKRKTSRTDTEEDQDDYVKNEEDWGKGNEALANIFYDKPDVSSMPPMQDHSDDDSEVHEEEEPVPRKRSSAGSRKRNSGHEGEDDQDFNELRSGNTKWMATDFEGDNVSEADKYPVTTLSREQDTQGSAKISMVGNAMGMRNNVAGEMDNGEQWVTLSHPPNSHSQNQYRSVRPANQEANSSYGAIGGDRNEHTPFMRRAFDSDGGSFCFSNNPFNAPDQMPMASSNISHGHPGPANFNLASGGMLQSREGSGYPITGMNPRFFEDQGMPRGTQYATPDISPMPNLNKGYPAAGHQQNLPNYNDNGHQDYSSSGLRTHTGNSFDMGPDHRSRSTQLPFAGRVSPFSLASRKPPVTIPAHRLGTGYGNEGFEPESDTGNNETAMKYEQDIDTYDPDLGYDLNRFGD